MVQDMGYSGCEGHHPDYSWRKDLGCQLLEFASVAGFTLPKACHMPITQLMGGGIKAQAFHPQTRQLALLGHISCRIFCQVSSI